MSQFKPGGMRVAVCRSDGKVIEEWNGFRCDGEAYGVYNGRVKEYRRQTTNIFDSTHTVELRDAAGKILQSETISGEL